ncbi:MAG: helical backbone metal receptor [Elusimicrobiota bacterium]|jgi:iron complex transport system substrate-binding protein|nr:helical backbone metal receptor [Elusimicrobiota bacterium]
MKKLILAIGIIFIISANVFSKEYARIVSIAPQGTNALYELGLDEQVKGITIYCPQGKFKKEIVGTILDPNIEKIISLKPDLVVASKDANNKNIVQTLRKFNIEVFVFEQSDSFKAICDNFMRLADLLDQSKKAREIIKTSQKIIEDIKEKNRGVPVQSVFWQVGSAPLYTAGRKSFLNDYNAFTNTKNIYIDINVNYLPVNIEDVYLRNPQIIAIITMDDDFNDAQWQKFKNLSAVKNKKIFKIDPDSLFGLTPLKFAQALEILEELFYK